MVLTIFWNYSLAANSLFVRTREHSKIYYTFFVYVYVYTDSFSRCGVLFHCIC